MSSEGFYTFPAAGYQGFLPTDEEGIFGSVFSESDELPPLPGDPYSQRDDVVRGITLSPVDIFDLPDGRSMCNPDKMHPQSLSTIRSTSSNSYKDFDEGHVPPPLSSEVKAFLEHTALQLGGYSPVTAGNRVLTFLRNEVDAQVDKVNQTKFTLKAVVVKDGLWCKIKVRIYQTEHGSLAEFQRRSGDTLAYHSLYGHVSEYLLGIRTIPKTLGLPYLAPLPADQTIAPLLDMADFCQNQGSRFHGLTHRWRSGDPCGQHSDVNLKWRSQNVNLLAEAAAALNAMSADPAVAAEMRMPCALSVLRQLETVDDFRVALPTSRLLSHN